MCASSASGWNRTCALFTPSSINSCVAGKDIYPKMFSPIFEGSFYSFYRYYLFSFISCLCAFVRPSAVFGRVPFVWVYSIHCMTFRLFPHVRQKHRKIIPSFAHFYASSSVVFKFVPRGVVASVSHVRPKAVHVVTRFISFCGKVVSCFSFSNGIRMVAPTRFSRSRVEIASCWRGAISAFASAQPFSRVSIFWEEFYNCKAKELFTDNVFWFPRHKIFPISCGGILL